MAENQSKQNPEETEPPRKHTRRRALVVSIHDVSPLSLNATMNILQSLRTEARVARTSLLVVPNHHGKAPIRDDRYFLNWVKMIEAEGHEPVLHGYYHWRNRNPFGSLYNKMVTEVYTAGEGEFYGINYEEAKKLIERGIETFREVGLVTQGFVAPAWLMSAEARKAASDLGLDYTTSLRRFLPLQPADSASVVSPALVWSVRNSWRRWTSLQYNRLLAQQVMYGSLVRLCIHPVDYQHKPIWRQIIRLARRFARAREVMTYAEYSQRLKERERVPLKAEVSQGKDARRNAMATPVIPHG